MQTQIAAEQRNWAMAAHLSALVAVAGLPFGHVLGPLVVYLVKGHEYEFVGEHARASLNYQITISILGIVAAIVGVAFTLAFLTNAPPDYAQPPGYGLGLATVWIAIGAAVLLVLLLSIVFIVLGSAAAAAGRSYTYPFAIRFLR